MIDISAKKLTLGYDGKIVVSDLNFFLNSGEFLSIIGENGSGKSTLIKAIMGVNKPVSGELVIGCSCEKKPQIGYLSQNTSMSISSNFPASVEEVVMSGCLREGRWSPFLSVKQKNLCQEKMSLLGIIQIKKCKFSELSGGQKQRVLLARALCTAKDGLILDEPIAGLDPIVTEDIYNTVSELKASGMTIVMVSHDRSRAIEYADKVLYIGSGEYFFGTNGEYLKRKDDFLNR